MAFLIPHDLNRIQWTCCVSGAELSNIERERVLYESAKNLAHAVIDKIVRECIRPVSYPLGYPSNTLEVDCYIIPPGRLYKLITDAWEQGQKDERNFNWQLKIEEEGSPIRPNHK